MKNNKKINGVIVGTIITFILLVIEVIMAFFNTKIDVNNTLGKILFTLIIIATLISVIYNLFAMIKCKDKDDRYYHLGLLVLSIILCILGIYKCM